MINIAVPYRHMDKENNTNERTTHIMSYLTFEDIKFLKDEWELNGKMKILDPWYCETVISELCGYRVELVDKKLCDLDEEDYKLIGKELRPVYEKALKCRMTDEVSTEFFKEVVNCFVKKMEYRVVEPHQRSILVQNLRQEPIKIKAYRNEQFIVPSLLNINSAYAEKREDVTMLTAKDVLQELEARNTIKKRKTPN